jgi:MFS transporter, ACS family, D-galactonate transporter
MPPANNDPSRHRSKYTVLAFLCAAAAIAYAQRQIVAVTKESIQRELHLSQNEIGWILFAFFLAYSLFQVPLGWIGDTYGARRSLALCMGLSALATSLLPLSASFSVMLALWTLCGAAQAGLFPIAARIIVGSFSDTRRAMASGALASAMSIGAAVTAALAGEMLAGDFFSMSISWKLVIVLAGAPGFVWAGAFLAVYREQPARSAPSPEPASGRESCLGLLATPALGLICLQQFLRAAGYIFFVSWFSTYLQESKSISIGQAGWLNSLPLLAVVVGAPLGGMISDLLLARTGSRRLSQQAVAVASLLVCAGCIVMAFWVESPLAATAVISMGSFFAALCGSIGYAVTMHLAGERVATVFGVMNMSGNFGAALFPLVAAQLRTANGDWTLVLALFAGVYVAAALCWMAIDPNRMS